MHRGQANLHVADPIEDYDPTVGTVRKALAALPPEAFNTADRVAAAILTAVDADRRPRRLVTGTFAVGEIRAALQSQLEELDAWAATAAAVDGTAG